jgi:hypothetical protein
MLMRVEERIFLLDLPPNHATSAFLKEFALQAKANIISSKQDAKLRQIARDDVF